MRIIDDVLIEKANVSWKRLIDNIGLGVRCLHKGDYVQPVKPYLRYGDPKNRIIAMPAFVGGPFNKAGIKWIASFPDNVRKNLPRAHSVVILNDAETGVPTTVFNTAQISIKRTAAVSGLMLKTYMTRQKKQSFKVGIIGWGPIGRAHMSMCSEMLSERLEQALVYDKRGKMQIHDHTGCQHGIPPSLQFADDWRKVYRESDIFITCTAGTPRYIDESPRRGQLLLHVSLRDYEPASLRGVKQIVIDDWREVCRENTDIEQLHLHHGLAQNECVTLTELVCENRIGAFNCDEPILFSPMGMAVFDLCTAVLYERELQQRE